jgi:hypothetical protein
LVLRLGASRFPAAEIHRAPLNLRTPSNLSAQPWGFDGLPNRERHADFERPAFAPSGSIGLDPSDLPGRGDSVHVMFYRVKGFLTGLKLQSRLTGIIRMRISVSG